MAVGMDAFRKKFNELDRACKDFYGDKNYKGYASIKRFAQTLSQTEKTTLLNLIELRNISMHDDCVKSVEQRTMDFMQGLIDGINRKRFNKYDGKVNTVVENERTKTLKSMSNMINDVKRKNSRLNSYELNEILVTPYNYIKAVQNAQTLNEIKNLFFKCKDYCSRVHLTPQVQKVNAEQQRKRQEQREKSLERKKQEVLDELESVYCQFISELSAFSLGRKKKASQIKKNTENRIKNCSSFSILEDIEEDIDNLFENLE